MKNDSALSQFRPAIRFLLIFVGAYFLGNILYGIYVEVYRPLPDPATVWVTDQAAFVISMVEGPVQANTSTTEPVVSLANDTKTVLRVFEGCNGLNVMIVFISFVIAFGGRLKSIIIFLSIGILLLHLANILRIVLLYHTALYRPLFFYYFHKYFFTAVLYLVVFGLWIKWTQVNSTTKSVPAKA